MRQSGPWLLILVAAVVAAIVVADLTDPSEATSRPDPVEAGPAVAGAWYCAAGAVGEDDELSVLTVATATAVDPADAEVSALHGDRTVVTSHPVFPGSARRTVIGSDLEADAVGIAARWHERPVVTSRAWRHQATEGISGMVSGPCVSGPSTTWYVPGVSTADGGSARLYLSNAFRTDASVTVTFTTPTGPEEPLLLQNVSIPAHSVAVLDLNEYLPREPDLGIVVRTRSGRVVAEAVQELDPAIGGVRGRTLVQAAPLLAETWTIPWSLTDPTQPTDEDGAPDIEVPELDEDSLVVSTQSPGNGTVSWLWVSNPGTEPAAITLTLHTAVGPVVPDIGDEIVIEPGRLTRIDLRGVVPAGLSAAGATLRSENGVPVAVSMSTLYRPDVADPTVTGYTSQLGWPESDTAWVVPGEAPGSRRQVTHVVNPTADEAVVDVAVWNGAVLARPEQLREVLIPPGHLVEFDVTELVAGASHMVVYVTATKGSVVAGRHSVGDSPVQWIAHAGVPSGLWAGGATVPSVDHDPFLVERLGTVSDADPDVDELEES